MKSFIVLVLLGLMGLTNINLVSGSEVELPPVPPGTPDFPTPTLPPLSGILFDRYYHGFWEGTQGEMGGRVVICATAQESFKVVFSFEGSFEPRGPSFRPRFLPVKDGFTGEELSEPLDTHWDYWGGVSYTLESSSLSSEIKYPMIGVLLPPFSGVVEMKVSATFDGAEILAGKPFSVTFTSTSPYANPNTLLGQPLSPPSSPDNGDGDSLGIVCPQWTGGELTLRVGEKIELKAEGGDGPYEWVCSDAYSSDYGIYVWPQGTWFGTKSAYGRRFCLTTEHADTGWKGLPGKVLLKVTVTEQGWKNSNGESATIVIHLLLLLGDLNGDKTITVEDIDLAQGFLDGKENLSLTQKEAGDVSGDDELNEEDIVLMGQYIAGEIQKFPKQEREDVNLAPPGSGVKPNGRMVSTWAKLKAQ